MWIEVESTLIENMYPWIIFFLLIMAGDRRYVLEMKNKKTIEKNVNY